MSNDQICSFLNTVSGNALTLSERSVYGSAKSSQGNCCPYIRESEEKLLRRLEKYKENHLLFLHDFTVPFENNLSERDLRKCKNRQKMSGGFRKPGGMEMYCSILSIVETCKGKEIQVLDTIKKIFEGTPAIF